jgi:leader peptidase (prepilin peptidase)/N-methyltransferase
MNFIIFLILIGVFSLAVGSFLNVVIYRLPIMLKKQWEGTPAKFTFNLAVPRSHCPKCKRILEIRYNIPLLSYLFLQGKCPYCKHKIPLRYPIVELITCALSVMAAARFGISIQTASVLVLTWSLVTLGFIDFEHLLLPDIITLPLLWLGLLLNSFHVFVNAEAAIIGAAAGYLSLYIIAWTFKLIRGIEGMGQGDFKLAAVFGAWLGWTMLPFVIFIAAVLGAIFGIIFLAGKKYSLRHPLPFGPYLAIAGWTAIMWGGHIFIWYSHLAGF